MAGAPESLERLIERLQTLPGVGRRTAERLAHHLLGVDEAEALSVADAIREARARIRPCSACRAPSETDPCPVCADPARDHGLLLVVETARDLEALEASGAWKGVYHVLGGRVSPLEGVGPEALAIEALVERARAGAREVCVATNPDLEGDATALHVARALQGLPVAVTRLARGMPAGGSLEYASKAVLAEALENRRSTGRAGAGDDSARG
jgi:recombination protein RecR